MVFILASLSLCGGRPDHGDDQRWVQLAFKIYLSPSPRPLDIFSSHEWLLNPFYFFFLIFFFQSKVAFERATN